MRSFVFTDEALTRQAGRFVWLSINTERETGAAFTSRFPVNAWPTLFVLDSASEQAVLRWVGGASVAEIEKLLDDGQRAVQAVVGGSEEALRKADRLYADAKYTEAIDEYRAAIDSAPADWPQRSRAVSSLLFALDMAEDYVHCIETARAAMIKLAGTPAYAGVAAAGLGCSLELPEAAADRKKCIAEFEAACRAVLADTKLALAADDRAGIYSELVSAREDAGDDPGMKQAAQECATFLEAQAAAAKTPEERAVFDSFRLNAYLALVQPERAVPMLEASERDLPEDYNPSARLSLALKALKRYDDAIAASRRALAKCYGPRQIRLLNNLSDVYKEKGDTAGARKSLEDAIKIAEALPQGQRSEGTIANLKKKIEGLGK